MFEATIIEDSISPDNIRLTTMHVRYWRPIHAELMTHRVFSRNARSSRAVPTVTLAEESVFIPQFMKNRPGMQATEQLDPQTSLEFTQEWFDLADQCRRQAESWAKRGMHKQWANRCLEWFGYIDVLISSTYWENFWELRRDGAAQPEIKILADLMYSKMDESFPNRLTYGEWHLPYIMDDERRELDINTLLKLSTARCARLSYKPFDGNANIEREIERYENLVVSRPVHASPAEHQATPDRQLGGPFMTPAPRRLDWEAPNLWGNFFGWKQHRKLIPNESVMEIQQWG